MPIASGLRPFLCQPRTALSRDGKLVVRCDERRISGRTAMRIDAHCVGKYILSRPRPNRSQVSGDRTWGIVARRKIGKLAVSDGKGLPSPDTGPISRAQMVRDEGISVHRHGPALLPEPGALLAPDPSGTRTSRA